MVFVWASPPGFLLLCGHVVPHVAFQELHVRIAPALNQNQWPQQRAFMYRRRPNLLLSAGTPLTGRHVTHAPPRGCHGQEAHLLNSLFPAQQSRNSPPQIHPCHSASCGSGYPRLRSPPIHDTASRGLSFSRRLESKSVSLSLSLSLSFCLSPTAQMSRKVRQFGCTALDDAMADPTEVFLNCMTHEAGFLSSSSTACNL